MPISWSEPSSSEASFDSGCARGHAEFGVPEYCWCGKFMKSVLCTTPENRGRRYFKCPATEDGGGEGRHHIVHKWWDEAVEEEFKRIHIRLEKQELAFNAFRYGGAATPAVESLRESIREMREEIANLKARLAEKETEIATLTEIVGKPT